MIDVDEVFDLLINNNVKSYSVAKMISMLGNDYIIDSEKQINDVRIPNFTVKVRHKLNYVIDAVQVSPSDRPIVLPYSTKVIIILTSWRTDDNEFYNTYNAYAGTSFVPRDINRVFFTSGAMNMASVIALAVLTKLNNIPGVYLSSLPNPRWYQAEVIYEVGYDFDIQKSGHVAVTMKYFAEAIIREAVARQ